MPTAGHGEEQPEGVGYCEEHQQDHAAGGGEED